MRKIVQIAPEGYRIIFITFFLTVILSSFGTYLGYPSIIYFSFCIFFCIIFFFRDPTRKIINDSKDFLSPADGKIVSIENYDDKEIGKSVKIAIFLSILDVHRQWVPLDSKVINTKYNPGKFSWAFMDKSSENNEHTSIIFDDHNNTFKIKQIAGFVARRIVNLMNINSNVIRGGNLGFIKFGSRVEIIVPKHFELKVKKGMKVKGCRTIIGKFN
tara:strand:+ start:613 stop:1257 length:645 start_codon:yes stop_codon:yes gene_type:complete